MGIWRHCARSSRKRAVNHDRKPKAAATNKSTAVAKPRPKNFRARIANSVSIPGTQSAGTNAPGLAGRVSLYKRELAEPVGIMRVGPPQAGIRPLRQPAVRARSVPAVHVRDPMVADLRN